MKQQALFYGVLTALFVEEVRDTAIGKVREINCALPTGDKDPVERSIRIHLIGDDAINSIKNVKKDEKIQVDGGALGIRYLEKYDAETGEKTPENPLYVGEQVNITVSSAGVVSVVGNDAAAVNKVVLVGKLTYLGEITKMDNANKTAKRSAFVQCELPHPKDADKTMKPSYAIDMIGKSTEVSGVAKDNMVEVVGQLRNWKGPKKTEGVVVMHEGKEVTSYGFSVNLAAEGHHIRLVTADAAEAAAQ